jgi:hypothetical protein
VERRPQGSAQFPFLPSQWVHACPHVCLDPISEWDLVNTVQPFLGTAFMGTEAFWIPVRLTCRSVLAYKPDPLGDNVPCLPAQGVAGLALLGSGT